MTPRRLHHSALLLLLAVPWLGLLAAGCGTVTGFDTPYNKGVHAYRDGRLPEAAEHFRNALDAKPDFYEAWYNLARTYDDLAAIARREGNQERTAYFTARAQASYERCIEVNPDGARALVAFGAFTMDQGDFEAARGMLLRAAEVEGDRAYPLAELGFYFQRQGRFDEAMTYYEQALEREPHDALTLYRIATWHEARDDLEEAIDYLEQAIDAEPNDAAAWHTYADLLVRAGRPRPAIAAYNQVLQLDPHGDGIPHVHFQIGLLHQELNRHELAIPYLWDARRLGNTEDAAFNHSIAEALARSYAALWRLETTRLEADAADTEATGEE